MFQYRVLITTAALALLAAGCANRPDTVRQEGARIGEKGKFTGMLHHSDPDACQFPGGCGPEFSLLDESLQSWIPLEGRIDSAHHNLVIEVEGKTTGISRDHREFLRESAGSYGIKVRRYRLLSSIPYHGFLVEQAGEFTTRKYGCELLWDKSFGWEAVGGRIHLLVRMTDTFSNRDPKPYLELVFDGETGHFLQENLEPWGTNPCAS